MSLSFHASDPTLTSASSMPPWSVLLVQAGKLQRHPYDGKSWETAIYKEPLPGEVTVDRYGIIGDEHTGAGRTLERALCCCPVRHYAFWEAYFRTSYPLGTFGENLTLSGLAEEDVCIGDVLRCGTVLMQVSMPRMPCYKQARRIGQPDFVKLIMQTGKIGFLTRIFEPGTIKVGDVVELVDRPLPEAPIPFVVRSFQKPDAEAAAFLATQPLLGEEWRERFAKQLLGDKVKH